MNLKAFKTEKKKLILSTIVSIKRFCISPSFIANKWISKKSFCYNSICGCERSYHKEKENKESSKTLKTRSKNYQELSYDLNLCKFLDKFYPG